LLSNEGGVKVLGFETGTGLSEQFAGDPAYAAYLAPECRAGEGHGAQDDVFSLSSILFELISGRPYADEPLDGEALTVQATGEGAPRGLVCLLERSFTPRSERIPNVLEWQQALGRLILSGEYNPTTFNLAFLMHTIMRDRLEKDIMELKREKSFILSQQIESELATEESSGPAQVEKGALESTDESSKASPEVRQVPPEESSTWTSASVASPTLAGDGLDPDRKPFWLGFALSAVVSGLVLGTLLVSASKGSEDPGPAVPLASTAFPAAEHDDSADQAAPPAWHAEPPATEKEPLADSESVTLTEVVNGELGRPAIEDSEFERLVAERANEIERNLKAEYEKKLETLRGAAIETPQGQPAQAAATAELEPSAPGSQGQAVQSAATEELEPSAPESGDRLAMEMPPADPSTDNSRTQIATGAP
ncbi:MAG: hypothetical protein GY769_15945, partial [bacterium]|nr:hypothetical protein [bacterium]